jgi:hypothetical protein
MTTGRKQQNAISIDTNSEGNAGIIDNYALLVKMAETDIQLSIQATVVGMAASLCLPEAEQIKPTPPAWNNFPTNKQS